MASCATVFRRISHHTFVLVGLECLSIVGIEMFSIQFLCHQQGLEAGSRQTMDVFTFISNGNVPSLNIVYLYEVNGN